MDYPVLPNLPPATPQRPLPGAFVPDTVAPKTATAPAQPAAAPQQNLPRMPPLAAKTQNQNLKAEERGAKTITETLSQESRYPNLDTTLSRNVLGLLELAQLLT